MTTKQDSECRPRQYMHIPISRTAQHWNVETGESLREIVDAVGGFLNCGTEPKVVS